MINKKQNYVEWTLLQDQLYEAHEHLRDLIKSMTSDKEFDAEDFRIDMAHIYSHLNIAWNSRNHLGEITDSQHDEYSAFPDDVGPLI